MDEMIEMDSVSFEMNNQRATPPRGRGSGRGSFSGSITPNRGRDFPVGRGRGRGRGDQHDSGYQSSPGRGRGRGQGRGGSKLRQDAPLSSLLYQERPYLRPVVFVRSVYTRTLFQEEEEILQPVVEEVGDGDQSHVPTADRVFRVFSGGNAPSGISSSSESEQDVSQELEEVDFNDMGKLIDQLDLPNSNSNAEVSMVEEKFSGFCIDTDKSTTAAGDTISVDNAPTPTLLTLESNVVDQTPILDLSIESQPQVHETDLIQQGSFEHLFVPSDTDDARTAVATMPTTEMPAIPEKEEFLRFYIDTEPSDVTVDPPQSAPLISHPDIIMSNSQIEEDEEIIVYVAPHPRSGRFTPAPTHTLDALPPDLPLTSILTGTTSTRSSALTPPLTPRPSTASSLPPASGSTMPHINAIPASSSSTQTPTPSFTPLSIPPAPPFFSSISISPAPIPSSSPSAHLQRQRRYQPPLSTPQHRKKAQVKLRMQEGRAARKRVQQQQVLFGSLGAMREEAQLRSEIEERDPRWEERRRGDSDVDWGDEDEDGGEDGGGGGSEEGDVVGLLCKGKGKEKEVKEVDGDGLAEGMDLDSELELDVDAMKSFVRGMGQDGQKFVTMDDIADGEMMRREDEDGDEDEDEDEDGGSSDEEDETDEDEEADAVVDAEEELLIAEAGVDAGMGTVGADDESEDDDDDDDSDDEWQSPRSGFQARLERLRSRARGKRPMDVRRASREDDESDDDDLFERNISWAEEDEEFIGHIQSILDENEDILTSRDRKKRNNLFRAVHNGAFEDIEDFRPARKSKDRYKDLPQDLQAQWQKDRDKKAENKRQRALARQALATDPLSHKKGGKKGRKAMLASAKLDPTITVLPNRIIDMTTLVQQIRRFLADVGGPLTMSLPPTNKETRKSMHEMAVAFGLRSQSKGKGNARYTTLIKTSRSGVAVDEGKITKIVRRSAGGREFVSTSGKRGGMVGVPKHREGDEVGKAAPKIGQSNIGFRMLASMGWSEGDRIGITGGLDVPLTAVIKHTKLGLGASK